MTPEERDIIGRFIARVGGAGPGCRCTRQRAGDAGRPAADRLPMPTVSSATSSAPIPPRAIA